MKKIKEILSALDRGDCIHRELVKSHRDAERIKNAIAQYQKTYGKDEEAYITICSAPGRTEICGNHTDHQRGRVLAAAVNVDFLAVAGLNDSDKVNFLSRGWPMTTVALEFTGAKEEEKETTASLIRGMADLAFSRGYKISGFDVYATSDVMPGSGLSSSAACEILLGTIINNLFCNNELTPITLAMMGQSAEQTYFGKPCGLMDQAASSIGGIITIDFENPMSPVVKKVPMNLEKLGYSLCIIDSGADHLNLTDEYASIPKEMKEVASFFGKNVLREVDENEFYNRIGELKGRVSDRGILRAVHFFDENARVSKAVKALENSDMKEFLEIIRQSGDSSWRLLQNIMPTGAVEAQAVAVAITVCERALKGTGAVRVHGGGFAGTIQAFVPIYQLDEFKIRVEKALGKDTCHIMSIRNIGGAVIF